MAQVENLGKMLITYVIIAVFAALILTLLGWIKGAVEAVSLVWGGIIGIVLVAILLIAAMRINPGKEMFLHLLPVLLIVAAIIGTIAIVWPASPLSFVVEWSLVGISLAIAAVVFANAVTLKVVKQIM